MIFEGGGLQLSKLAGTQRVDSPKKQGLYLQTGCATIPPPPPPPPPGMDTDRLSKDSDRQTRSFSMKEHWHVLSSMIE